MSEKSFNTYTQAICVDNAVVVDPERAENVVTNDGVTMRILAQKMKKASVWRQLNEYVTDGQLATVNTEPKPDEKPTAPSNSGVLSQVDVNQLPADTNLQATAAAIEKDSAATEAKLAELAAQAHPPATAEEADQALKVEAGKTADANAKLTADREAFLAKQKAATEKPVDVSKELAKKDADFKAATTGRKTGLASNADQVYAWSMEKAIGTSQIVQFSSKFVDKLSEISDDMNASAALSIKAGSFGGSGNGAFIDTEKFHDSDIKFYLSVKVINQSINFKDALQYNPIRSIRESDQQKFTECFGNAFISGFLEGGELNAVVMMKVKNDIKRQDIMAEAKVALTVGADTDIDGEGNVKLAKSNVEMNSEVTINVRWSGGASIKGYDEQWTIDSLLAAANRFPYLVSQFPQRTYAILTKYESLRSFVMLKPKKVSPIKYENAAIYTNQLMDAYMEYSVLFKRLTGDIKDLQTGLKRFKVVPPPATDASGIKTVAPQLSQSKSLKASKLERFEASIAGLDAARRAIRTQMNNIVREVDSIERNPNIATQDRSTAVNGGPVFVGPASFQTLIPEVEYKVRKIRNEALSNKLITADKATDQGGSSAATPGASFEVHLFDPSTSLLALSEIEQIKVADLERDQPSLSDVTRVSPPVGSTTGGDQFCTIDIGLQDPIISSIRVMRKTTAQPRDMIVRAISVTYSNGFTVEYGDTIGDFDEEDDANDKLTELDSLEGLNASEMITSAKIEVDGDVTDPEGKIAVVGVCFVTNKGKVLNALTSNDRTKMSDGRYYRLHSFEKPITDGYISGFWGRATSTSKGTGRINRLGLVWTQAVVKEAVFDDDLPIECLVPQAPLDTATTAVTVPFLNRKFPGIPQLIWGLRSLTNGNGVKPALKASMEVGQDSFKYQLAPTTSNTSAKAGWMVLPELKKTHIQCGQVKLNVRGGEPSEIVVFDLPFSKPNVTPNVICWIIDFTSNGDSLDIKVGPIDSSIKSGSFELKASDSGGKFDISSTDGAKRNLNYSDVTVGWLAHSPISTQTNTTFLSGKTEVGIGSDGTALVTVPYTTNFGGKPNKHFIALSGLKIPDFRSTVSVSGEPRLATAQQFKMDVVGPANGSFSAVWVSAL
ncbi:hypothetical protein OC846_004166 [Tilletia horrida]|uniref:H-type lectin domain-containing protein n=1 Tax=Tilletia horrida TaxID=155126 RepID=A0AAN6GMR3_9BASI|nr:hypothetical protein OC846_004166 [Tilletia horrida]KAK0569606.1 hypothetical protein OC861_000786 [Tilletia horrida]